MQRKGSLSVTASALLLVTTMFGAGLLDLPTGFAKLGNAFAPVALLLVGLVTFASLVFLTYSAEASQLFTYSELCKEVGKPLSVLLDCSVVCVCYGATLGYGILLANYAGGLIPKIAENVYLNRAVVGFPLLAPLFFLANLKSIEKLRFVTWLTVVATFTVALELLYYKFIAKFKFDEGNLGSGLPNAGKREYTSGISSIIFSLGCQQSVVPAYAGLRNRSFRSSIIMAALACTFGLCIYGTVGMVGFGIFGNSLRIHDFMRILANSIGKDDAKMIGFAEYVRSQTFDKNGIIPMIPVLAFIGVLFAAFPVQTYAAKQSMLNLLPEKLKNNSTLFFMTVIQFIAVYTCIIANVEGLSVIRFLGIVACPVMAFVCPSVIYMKIVGRRRLGFYLAAAILPLAAGFMTVGLYDFVSQLRGSAGQKVSSVSSSN